MNYQETGNKIPVSEDELIQVMITKYDAFSRSNGSLPNPDTEKIIYTTQDGKTIQIPDDIKIKAKTMWLTDLAKKVKSEQVRPEEVGIVPKKVIQIYDNTQRLNNIFILVIAVAIAIWLLYKFGSKFRESYNIGTEELKFYLGRK